ncbi:hypothetical protein AAFF_G00380110 [Aldrovandia affinis]|uniref:C2H2-type domain-containing protein n=1 Tax=Aldrovandia affinis TaxID=143900 RepID=A0AAD7T7R1_9TELE|nr:hypothetical protein AAFF_G00380110 [Aldrovandia affinis]
MGVGGEDSSGRTGPGGAAQRTPRPSAFPSSLAWDSDSEKETLDEEELQHFSNPHGLAAHSPGSPAPGHRQDRADGEGDKAPEELQHLIPEDDPPSPVGGPAHKEKSQRQQHSPAHQTLKKTVTDSWQRACLLSRCCRRPNQRMGAGERERERGTGGREERREEEEEEEGRPGAGRRRRRKRALLKPFSGLGSQQGPLRRAKGGPSGAREGASREAGGVVFQVTEKECGGDGSGRAPEVEREKAGEEEALCQDVFTCVECSIYFKKQCGWELEDGAALDDHRRRHRESREKILEEIGKLSQDGTGTGAAPPRLRCPRCSFGTDSSRVYVEHAKTHSRERSSSSSSPGARGRAPSSPTALREHLLLTHHTWPQTWEEEEEEGCPGTSRDFLNPARPPPRPEGEESRPQLLAAPLAGRGKAGTGKASLKVGAALKGGRSHSPLTPAPPRRRDVAFKSIGNRRAWRRGGGEGTGSTSPSEAGETKDQVARQDQQRNPAPADLKEALQLKRSFSDGLRGASESLGLTEGQQTQLRHMLPLVRIEPFHFSAQTPSAIPGLGGRVRAAGDFRSFREDNSARPVVEDNDDEEEEEENDEHDDDDDEDDEDDDEENLFLTEGLAGEEMGMLKNVERKCPYCPDRFHNGIGLANHVRGHLNRVGVSYNVRHFISPEEVNAIERKFSYQKKRKKVANFDPDTFSLMRCEFCSAGFDTRAGLSSHARAHLRDFGITNWEVTVSPINILRELFSSRPDLVLPTAPPSSPPLDPDSDEEEDSDEEPEGARASQSRPGDGAFSSLPASPTPPVLVSSQSQGVQEDDMPAVEGVPPGSGRKGVVPSDSGNKHVGSTSPSDEPDTKAAGLLRCEVCGAPFETRRGLSSHARSHLRQLGIGVSESSGAPIDLLYQLIKERDGRFSPSSSSAKKPSQGTPASRKDLGAKLGGAKASVTESKATPLPVPSSAKAPGSSSRSSSPATLAKSRSASPLLRKAPISSLLPASSPLRSLDSKPGGGKTGAPPASAKPFWAPQETDAPLNLTMDVDASKDIVCQLCGAWFETRKGLSSHARAHLRHFGVVDAETKGSPIDYLNQLIHTDDFKHRAGSLRPDDPEEPGGVSSGLSPPSSSSSSSSAKRPSLSSASSGLYKAVSVGGSSASKSTSSPLLSSPSKRYKPSAAERAGLQVFRLSGGELTPLTHGEPLKEILGITEWSVNGSPIDTLRELITRRGLPCALPLRPLKSPPASSPGSPRSPPSSPTSPGLLKRLPFSPGHAHQPTARKMAAGLLPAKLKPEPMQVEVGMAGVGEGRYPSDPLSQSWHGPDSILPLNLVAPPDPEPTRDIRCEFCGEYFENRKGLSSHARSHLRQLGITEWSVNGSPIDTLRELMRKKGAVPAGGLVKKEPGLGAGGGSAWDEMGYLPSPKFSRKSPLSLLHSGSRLLKQGLGLSSPPSLNGKFLGLSPLGKRSLADEGPSSDRPPPKTFSPPSPLDFSFKGKSSPDKYGSSHSASDASCELCGFYFENRKALASHARAHLRQFGVTEWCVNGSPIETLSAWMRSKPHKVAEMHRRYMQGDRPFPKKKCGSSPSPSSDSDPMSPGVSKPLSSHRPSLGLPVGRRAGREVTGGTWGASRASQGRAETASSLQSHAPSRQAALPPHSQVARSELNVRSPRGFERRPPKHLPHSESGERDAGPQPPRTGTIPALVPKPPSTPLVKLVGKIYSLKCRFCEVEFQGPLSVQEDWVRHLQQHILDLNFNKPAPPSTPTPEDTPTPAFSAVLETRPCSFLRVRRRGLHNDNAILLVRDERVRRAPFGWCDGSTIVGFCLSGRWYYQVKQY